MIGKTLAHYEILEKLGEGGMGEVWLARDLRQEREVALNLLPETHADDPASARRLEREAKLLASLEHPNIAAIHGFHEERIRPRFHPKPAASFIHLLVLYLKSAIFRVDWKLPVSRRYR